MMSSLHIKMGQTRSFNSEYRQKITQKSSSVKSQMQFIRERIDTNLKKAHEKLKIDGFSRLKQKNSYLKNENNTAQLNNLREDKTSRDSVKLICLKRRNNYTANGQYYTPIVKQSKDLALKDQIALVDNRVVMEYIKLIYEGYNIKDPLQNTEQIHSEQTIQKNNGNFCNFKEYDSINSARTLKERQQNIVEVSQFDVDKQFEMKKTTNKKNNKTVITLRTNSAQKTKQKQQKRIKNNPLLKLKEKQEIHDIAKDKNKMKGQQSQKQVLIFMVRYCFACQQPILQQSLKRHQSQCHNLKQALTWSFQKILETLDNKIQRIVNLIKNKIINVSNHTFNRQYEQLQRYINSLIMHDQVAKKHKIMTYKPNKQQKIQQFQTLYERIQQNIDSNYNKKFELLNKLRWFTKLRYNIQSKYTSI